MITDPELISAEIVDAALRVHRGLGPGLIEKVNQRVLAWELERRSLLVERERHVRIIYEGRVFRHVLRVDLLVNRVVVVELKSVPRLTPPHFKQLYTYLRLLDLPLGLLINFGAPTLKGNIRRVVNGHTPSAASKLRINQPPPSQTDEADP